MQIIPEGTLLSATPNASTAKLTEHGQFKPTVRPLNQRLAPTAVWRGFDIADRHHDQARRFHRIAARPLPQFHQRPVLTTTAARP